MSGWRAKRGERETERERGDETGDKLAFVETFEQSTSDPIQHSRAEQRRCVPRLRTAVPCRAVRCCLPLQGAPPLAGSRQVFYSWCIHQLTHSCSSRPAGRRRRRRRTMRTATSWPMAARNRPAGRAHASAARGRRTLQRPLVALRCNCKQPYAVARRLAWTGLLMFCLPCWPFRSPMHVRCSLAGPYM